MLERKGFVAPPGGKRVFESPKRFTIEGFSTIGSHEHLASTESVSSFGQQALRLKIFVRSAPGTEDRQTRHALPPEK